MSLKKCTYTIAVILSALLCASCQPKGLIDETRTFDNQKWLHFSPEQFEFEVTDIDEPFNIYISATIDSVNFKYTNLPLVINLFGPSGEQRNFRSTLYFKDKNNVWLGDWNGTNFTHTSCIRPFFFFNEKGKYRMEVTQGTDRYELNGVSCIGLKIEQAELEYPK